MSTQLGQPEDVAREFGFSEGIVPAAKIEILLNKHTVINGSKIKYCPVHSVLADIIDSHDLTFEIEITDSAFRQIGDHQALHSHTGQEIGLRLTLQEDDIPLTFEDSYISGIRRNSYTCSCSVTVISTYRYDKYHTERVKRRERNQPSLKRFRIISEED